MNVVLRTLGFKVLVALDFKETLDHKQMQYPPNNVLFDLRSLTTILGGNRIITANNYRPQSIVIPVIANLSLSDNTMRIVLQTASGTTYFEIQNVNLIYIRLSS